MITSYEIAIVDLEKNVEINGFLYILFDNKYSICLIQLHFEGMWGFFMPMTVSFCFTLAAETCNFITNTLKPRHNCRHLARILNTFP